MNQLICAIDLFNIEESKANHLFGRILTYGIFGKNYFVTLFRKTLKHGETSMRVKVSMFHKDAPYNVCNLDLNMLC